MKNLLLLALIALGILAATSPTFAQLPIKIKPKPPKKVEPRVTNDPKKNGPDPRESQYKPSTQKSIDCQRCKSTLENYPNLDKNIDNYKDEDLANLKTGLEAVGNCIKTITELNCDGHNVKELAAQQKNREERYSARLKVYEAKQQQANKDAETRRGAAQLFEVVSYNMMSWLPSFQAKSTIDANNFLRSSGKTIRALQELNLQTRMAEYKRVGNDDMKKIIARLEASNDEEWSKRNDAAFKSITELHNTKKENFLVYLWADAMVRLSDEVFKFNPNHGAFRPRYDAYKRYLTETKQVMKAYMSSPLHEKNLGKIVFSNAEIKVKQENEASFKNNFSNKEMIYAMAYLPTNKDPKGVRFQVKILDEKGQEALSYHSDWYDDFMTANDAYIPIFLVTDPYKHAKEFVFTPQHYEMAGNWNKLPYRKQTLTAVVMYGDVTIAEGQFTIDLTDGLGSISDMEQKHKTLSFTFLTPPPARMKDPSFESAALANHNKQNGSEVSKIHRIIMHGGDWSVTTKRVIVQNKVVDVPDYRTRHYTIVYTDKQGKCYYQFNSGYQYHNGSAYGATTWSKTILTSGGTELPCQNINR